MSLRAIGLASVLQFGRFRIDPVQQVLWLDSQLVPVGPKVVQTLAILASREGEVVSKDDLIRQVWGDTVVEDNSVARNISVLRKLLRDASGDDFVIETSPKRGYRFYRAIPTAPTGREKAAKGSSSIVAHAEVPSGSYTVVLEPMVSSSSVAEAEESANELDSGASPKLSPRALRGWLIAAILSGVALAAASYVLYRSAGKGLPFQTISTEKITHSGDVTVVAISPDGKYIVTARSEEGLESLWLRNIATGTDVQIVAPGQVHYRALRLSRDGNFLYFVRSEQQNLPLADLYRLPVLGGQPERLITDVDSNVSFSPDGKNLVFITYGTDQYRLEIASQDGRSQRSILQGPMSAAIFDPAWSPDGKVVVAATRDIGKAFSTLIAIDVASGKSRAFFKSDTAATKLAQPVWLSDGSGLLVLVGNQASNFEEQQIALVTYPQGKIHPVTRETNNYSDISLAADGHTLATVLSDARWDLFVMHPDNPDDAGVQQLTSDAPIQSFSWTPEDKLIIWQNFGLSMLDPVTGGRSRLSIPTTSLPSQPSVCRDGHVVFILPNSNGDEGQGIWRVDADGQNLTQLTQGPHDRFPMCASDSQSVYYEDFEENGNFWKVSLSGGYPQPVMGGTLDICLGCDYRLFDLSSDGGWAVFPTHVGADSHNKLALLSLSSAAMPRVLDLRTAAFRPVTRFAGSSNWLAYPVRTRGIDNLWAQEVDGPGIRQLTHFTSGRIRDFEFSPRGDRLAFTRAHFSSDVVLIRDSNH
jgi:DNA-binding winged helix-turn-helix (wHTH) protein/Tol biopolymer transport system component